MKKFTKTLSIVLLVAMCVSMFTISSFAADNLCPVCNDGYHTINAHSYYKAPSCTADGEKEHHRCTYCDTFFWDAAGTQKIEGDVNAQKVIPAQHSLTFVSGTAAGCETTGVADHYLCSECGKKFSDANGAIEINTGIAANGHNPEMVPPVAATCTDEGVNGHYKCTDCGKLFLEQACTTELSEAQVIVAPAGHKPSNGVCTECGELDPESVPAIELYATNGSNAKKHVFTDNKTSFEYTLKPSDVYEITGVTVGGKALTRPTEYNYDSGYISIKWSTINSLMDEEMFLDVVFTVQHKASKIATTVSDFIIENGTGNAAGMGELYVGRLQNASYVKYSNDNLLPWFVVGSNKVQVYLINSASYTDKILAEGSFGTASDGKVTFTFDQDFLNQLYSGYYTVRLYANGSMLADQAELLEIRESGENAGITNALNFCNNNIDITGPYQYKSGDERPMLKSSMFTMNETLQYSSDIRSGWRNVGVNNYYVEQSNGKDTAYAYIGTAFLNSLEAGETYYFRVVVPAKELGRSTDLISNSVVLETGNNIRAVDTDKHVINSSKSLKFVASVPVDVVKVGNIALEEGEDYAMSKDGKTITLFADFLNKRTAGSTYTLTAITADGEELKTTFKILTTAQASASPRTGDDSNIALWSALVLMSGAAVVAVLPRLKKER